jgi:hypothetical protein
VEPSSLVGAWDEARAADALSQRADVVGRTEMLAQPGLVRDDVQQRRCAREVGSPTAIAW